MLAIGYQVIVNRVGTVSLDRCTVTAIRPGQRYSRVLAHGFRRFGAGNDVVTTITKKTVYVDVPAAKVRAAAFVGVTGLRLGDPVASVCRPADM